MEKQTGGKGQHFPHRKKERNTISAIESIAAISKTPESNANYISCIKYLKWIFIAIVISTLLVQSMTLPTLAAAERSVAAQVTVSTFINFTVTDYGSAGLKFGSLTPGSKNNPETDQNVAGAVSLQLGADSNTDCNIVTKANDFTSGGDKLTVNNVTWNTSNDPSAAATMADQYAIITTLKPGQSQRVWHWLNVPASQAPGIYSADFYYQAARAA